MRYLPADEDQAFVTELVETLEAADAMHNLAPVFQVVNSWQHAAEVYADPELAAALSAEGTGDHEVVPDPSTAG